jgi:hypothetical protein
MKISNIAAQQLLDEFIKSKVVVIFSNKLIQQVITILGKSEATDKNDEDGSEFGIETKILSLPFRSFSITINNKFTSSIEDSSMVNSSMIDPQYPSYIGTLKDKVLTEIEDNINLRIGKWDILNYLTNLEFELKEIRKKFKMSEVVVHSESGVTIIKPDAPFEMDEFPIYENSNIKIEFVGLPEPGQLEIPNMEYCLSRYWDIQINVIERLIRYIEPRKRVIEITDDYVKVINILPVQPSMLWTKSDTALLEFIIALHESGAIQNSTKDLTQKEAILMFSDFFGKEIKDQYKKLNAARNRKKEDPGFIIKMQKAMEAYYQGLNDKN